MRKQTEQPDESLVPADNAKPGEALIVDREPSANLVRPESASTELPPSQDAGQLEAIRKQLDPPDQKKKSEEPLPQEIIVQVFKYLDKNPDAIPNSLRTRVRMGIMRDLIRDSSNQAYVHLSSEIKELEQRDPIEAYMTKTIVEAWLLVHGYRMIEDKAVSSSIRKQWETQKQQQKAGWVKRIASALVGNGEKTRTELIEQNEALAADNLALTTENSRIRSENQAIQQQASETISEATRQAANITREATNQVVAMVGGATKESGSIIAGAKQEAGQLKDQAKANISETYQELDRAQRELAALKLEISRKKEASLALDRNPQSGSRWVKKEDTSATPYVFLGFDPGDPSKVWLEDERGNHIPLSREELEQDWERSSLVFSERFEDKEVSLDMAETRQLWEKFYTDHNLREFADHLPQDIKFAPEGEERIREALRMGFDRAMILPPTVVQDKHRGKMIKQMEKDYPNPTKFWSEEAKNAPIRNRPAKAYMVLYSSRPIPQETKGLNQSDQEKLFKQKKWNGSTLPEFLMRDRLNYETTGNHDLYVYSNDATKSNWARQLDGADSSGAVDACWAPDNRWVGVDWRSPGGSNPRLGACPVVVVEIL